MKYKIKVGDVIVPYVNITIGIEPSTIILRAYREYVVIECRKTSNQHIYKINTETGLITVTEETVDLACLCYCKRKEKVNRLISSI